MLLQSYLSDQTQFVKYSEMVVFGWKCDSQFQGISINVSFAYKQMIFRYIQIYRSSNIADLEECYDKVKMDLGRILDLATAKGLKNSEKSQVKLIHQIKAVYL
jgi:hypothetical protein